MHEGHEETELLPAATERVGRAVLNAAFAVHKSLGPGLLESVYEACLAEELQQAGLAVGRQVGIPITYGEVRMDVGYRLDLLVERAVIKSIDALASIHTAQVLTYLRFSGVRLGYLINFNTAMLKNGLRRSCSDPFVSFVTFLVSFVMNQPSTTRGRCPICIP